MEDIWKQIQEECKYHLYDFPTGSTHIAFIVLADMQQQFQNIVIKHELQIVFQTVS